MLKTDTIAAVATPPGEGGIAVVRVSGPEARRIAARVFRPGRGGDPASFPGYSVHYGEFVDAAAGEVADDGLLTIFHAPHSYTGEDVIELACHGGRMTTARVLQLTLAAGARLAEPGEFTQRAFLNGRLDLAQAEAVADVIRARTESARRLARRQLEGALSQAVAALKDELIGILAAIEVTIDFSDEVGELEYESLTVRIAAARAEVERLLTTAERGRILREGLRVAIVGKPNVGKSSLLNALLRTERAIVTPIAGTTRDLVEETANVGGIPIVLVDTAGIRETADVVERIGVARAENAAADADVVLFVLDSTTGVTEEDRVVAQQLKQTGREILHVLIVLNKCDAVSPAEAAAAGPFKHDLPFPYEGIAHVSALTGQNMDVLEQMLIRVVSGNGGADEASVMVANTRHREALEAALASLREAERTAVQRLPGDFIAIDVRGALDSLGLITGETVTDEIIHRIFHDFCVGK
jgi:tRNA modification GTPase